MRVPQEIWNLLELWSIMALCVSDLQMTTGRSYWRFCGNIVADDHRASATMLLQSLQYNLVLITLF
jgi:hypothetical protein